MVLPLSALFTVDFDSSPFYRCLALYWKKEPAVRLPTELCASTLEAYLHVQFQSAILQ